MKTALITGAYRGIGLETARQLGRQNFHVFIAARRENEGLQAVETLKTQGISAQFVMLDVTNADSIKSAVAVVEKEGQLDVLVNNAAVALDDGKDILNVDVETWKRTFETNVFGPLEVAKAFWPLLLKSDDARVINVSSGLGRLYDMSNETPSYAASKTALNAITRQLSDLGKDTVSVNSICPGWVKTEMGGQNAPRSVEQGCAIIMKLVTMENPPTGKYLNDDGEIGW